MRMDSVRSTQATRVRMVRLQMFQSISVAGLEVEDLGASPR